MPDIWQTEADSYPDHFYKTKGGISGRDIAWKISTRSNLKWPINVKQMWELKERCTLKYSYHTGGAGDYGGRLASCYDFKQCQFLQSEPRFFFVLLP